MGGIYHWALGICVAGLLAGCQTESPKQSNDLAAGLKDGSQAVLLIRTVCQEGTNVSGTDFKAIIGEMEKHSQVDQHNDWKTPSMAAAADGWYYLLLQPGSHYLEIDPDRLRGVLDPDDTNSTSAYYIYLPPGQHVIYGGTFVFSRKPSPHGWFYKYLVDPSRQYYFKRLGVTNELNEARRVAGESLQALGEVIPAHPLAYDTWPSMPGGRMGVPQFESNTNLPLTAPAVGADQSAMVAAPLLVPGVLLLYLGSRNDENCPNYRREAANAAVVVAGLVFILAAYPFGELGEKTFGNAARKKWAPYEAAEKKDYADFNLEQHLIEATRQQLSTSVNTSNLSYQTTTTTQPTIRIQPYRVHLDETRFGKFTLEVAVRASILDPETKNPLWAHDYVYTDRDKAKKIDYFLPAIYETIVNAQSEPHSLADYERDSGLQLFHSQLTNAVTAISTEIASQIHEAGGTK